MLSSETNQKGLSGLPMKPHSNKYKEQILLLDPQKPVYVYRNLHRKCWSVRQGVVRFHCDIIVLSEAQFIVRQKGRERVLAERSKNVHAFVKGFLKKLEHCPCNLREAYYNPYITETFVCGDEPVLTADFAVLIKSDKMKVFKGDKKVTK